MNLVDFEKKKKTVGICAYHLSKNKRHGMPVTEKSTHTHTRVHGTGTWNYRCLHHNACAVTNSTKSTATVHCKRV
jgi:hypothetical protein